MKAAIGSTKASETQESCEVVVESADWIAVRLTETLVTGR
ncbi:hypothetical protein GA0115252_16956 [Streptomyces sp. DfronAA-171]|nr:hypothetical protein GA0115252_16956 [Streptomyces sp. DfronAA-171]